MDIFKLAALPHTAGHNSVEQLEGYLDNLVQVLGTEAFCRQAAKELVRRARPESVLPDRYARFRPLVHDGIEFFLSRISYPRLRKAVTGLLQLEADSPPGAMLVALALNFPTLHKLGQVIARHADLDPAMKQWLILLESGSYGSDPDRQVRHIQAQLGQCSVGARVRVVPEILAEASVAAVLPFTWDSPDSDRPFQGVFKVLRPAIAEHLRAELHILEQLVAFFEADPNRYALQDLRLAKLFREVQEDLVREIDLAAEQAHLAEAASIYAGVETVSIPKLAPMCNPTMTAMEWIKGPKITDAELTLDQRTALARAVVEALICTPLFSRRDRALFHGDPHAGNILATAGSKPGSIRLGLIDWTLAGQLDKQQRVGLLQLLTAILKQDPVSIGRSIEGLSKDSCPWEPEYRKHAEEVIRGQMASPRYQACSPLKKSFSLLEQMTLEGVVFPSALLLFRKAFFTLEGVLSDIAPGFTMEPVLDAYIGRLVLKELPQRMGNCFFPALDKPEGYQSLLPNQALGELTLHQVTACLQQTVQGYTTLFESQAKLTTDFFSFMTGGLTHSR